MGTNSTLTTEYDLQDSIVRSDRSEICFSTEGFVQQRWDGDPLFRSQLDQAELNALDALSYQVCLLDIQSNSASNVQQKMYKAWSDYYEPMIKYIFEQHSFRAYTVVEHRRFVILAFDLLPAISRKEQLAKKELLHSVATKIEVLLNRDLGENIKLHMAVSTSTKGIQHTTDCYEEASKAILLQALCHTKVIFYDDLGAFQILLNLHEEGLLQTYVRRHLGPLLDEDRKKNSDLLKTLKIYLARDGSKQSVADELHIVRQSLYYRLEKIKELLGEDYMCTQNRLALQLAIQAYELLSCRAC